MLKFAEPLNILLIFDRLIIIRKVSKLLKACILMYKIEEVMKLLAELVIRLKG